MFFFFFYVPIHSVCATNELIFALKFSDLLNYNLLLLLLLHRLVNGIKEEYY